MRRFRTSVVMFVGLGALSVGVVGATPVAASHPSTRSASALAEQDCKAEKKLLKGAKGDLEEADDDGKLKAYKRAQKDVKEAKGLLSECTGGGTDAEEVRREPISKPTRSPFAPPVGQDETVTPVDVAAPTTVPGGEVGLYGGTMNYSQCDREQLKTFLQQNPDKGGAWAEVLGITFEEIPAYVDKLTPVILRSDTRVTNHSFKNGKATPLQSVLQAGTAVLVDEYGAVVTKCYCGNPLRPPTYVPPSYTPPNGTTTTTYYEEPPYYGPKWPEWTPTVYTVIEVNGTVIRVFVLTDPKTGRTFNRPAGTDGSSDQQISTRAPTPKPSTTTTTHKPSTTTTTYYYDCVDEHGNQAPCRP